ncbi:hypothetical protein F9C29_29665, partial [Enterobacter hormaechei]
SRTARTNQRDDEWGGDYARRMRFAVEVVRAARNSLIRYPSEPITSTPS